MLAQFNEEHNVCVNTFAIINIIFADRFTSGQGKCFDAACNETFLSALLSSDFAGMSALVADE